MTPLGTLFPSGTATSIGSLPHTDADTAARLVLDLHPSLPAAPQLPMLSAAEGMLAKDQAQLEGAQRGAFDVGESDHHSAVGRHPAARPR